VQAVAKQVRPRIEFTAAATAHPTMVISGAHARLGRRSLAVYRLGDDRPTIHGDAWVAPNAVVVGRVQLDKGASVWFGATLRGDTERIHVGENSNVQDGSVLHSDPGFPLTIGTRVTVGHMVCLHGCIIGDGSLIGIGSTILNGVKIGRNCLRCSYLDT